MEKAEEVQDAEENKNAEQVEETKEVEKVENSEQEVAEPVNEEDEEKLEGDESKEDGDEGEEEENPEESEEYVEPWRRDVRMLHIRSMVEKLGNIKPDQWIRMIDKIENREPVFDFLDKVEHTKLLFLKIGAAMIPSLNGFPTDVEISKGKFVYFLRRSNREEITETNYKQAMLVGSCSDNPIRDFSIYVNNAMVPLLMNPKNQGNWPQVLKDEMRKKLQDLRNSITEAMGAINDRTVFPLPVTLPALMRIAPEVLERGDMKNFTPAIKESIEQIVLRWSRSVNAYVARSSYDIFKTKKYATPDDEMEFWRARVDNLKNIFNQLRTKEIKTIALILEKVESAYVSQMKRILSSVASAYEEAYDIDLYLKPLQYQLDKMRSTEFSDAHHFIAPLLHTIVLIWSKSKHLSSNQRIVHLFQLLHHKLFEYVCDALNPTSIFAGDIADTLEKIDKTLKNLAYYKEVYVQYRTTLDQYKAAAENAEYWTFDPDEIFGNFDAFVQRVVKTNEMLQLLFELKKMEDTVFGGHTGKRVTQTVQKIADSVSILTDSLKDIQFNVFDLDETDNFERLTVKFGNEVTDFQQRLAKEYATSFDECNTISKCLKLTVNLGNTLQLPIVMQELSPKFERIAKMLEKEVIDVEELFKTQSPFYKTKPLEELLIWSAKLKSRLTEHTRYMDAQRVKLFDSDFGHYTIIRYSKILEVIESWEKKRAREQIDQYDRQTEEIMKDYLLHRNKKGKLSINVRPQLDLIFQGINRLTLNGMPLEKDALKELWKRRDELWNLKMKLYRITEWYNFTRFDVHAVEKRLIEPNADAIDQLVEDFLSKFTWKTYDNTALNELFNTLEHLYKRIVRAHGNIDRIKAKIHSWGDVPFFERIQENDNYLLNIQNRDKIVKKRYKQCIETQELIENVMRENYCLFQNKLVTLTSDGDVVVEPNVLESLEKSEEEQRAYKPYEAHIDQMVGEEVLAAVVKSLKYIYDQIREPSPLFEVCFCLDRENRKSIFHPDLDVDEKEGFVSFVTSLMVNIFGMAGLIKRITNDPESSTDFTSLLKDNPVIEEYRLDLVVQSKKSSKDAIANFKQYEKFSFLWKIEQSKYLDAFLKYGRELTADDLAKIDDESFNEEPQKPSLEAIEHEIKRHRDLVPQIEQIPEFVDIEPWFRVKTHLFKTKLIAETMKWINLFIDYLHNHVANRLDQLEMFILDANIVLAASCDKSELEKFRTMHNLMNEIERQAEEVDFMFEPLKAEVMLLRKYDHEMETKVKEQFVELPLSWIKLKKLKNIVRTDIDPVKEHQMNLTGKRIKLFGLRLRDFNKRFRRQAFFSRDCQTAYELIDQMLEQIIKYEKQAELLDIFAVLFNINVGPNRAIMQECRRDTKVLKQVWDYWYSMQHRIYLWENTLWSKIDVEAVEGECKRIAKEVRAMDTCCKQWDPFVVLEGELLNLMTSLRVLTSIQNPSIKERHIDELRGIVGYYFEINEKTTFNDLVMLKLHLYEDQVKELVDKAVKEQAIEKALVEIVKVWSDIGFEYEQIGNKKLLKVSDDFMELLEDNLTQLQSMMDSKFVGYFYDQVSEWLKKVFSVQQVVELWMEAQRKWVYLEVIFVGSEDINEQLPEEARKFAVVDQGFRKEVEILEESRTAVDACGREGLIEYLKFLEPELADCERALNAYLETKRLAYPRFYFVSTADLLDILSNATNPEYVGKHLTKLYDSLAKLIFRSDGTKQAYAMHSKENGEEVEFLNECSCEGQVEVWLNRTTDSMRETLHNKFEGALKAYATKPRHQWIFDWPAQPALCTTQIVWSRDTDAAFAELEAGFENALRNYQKIQVQMLNALINLLMGTLTKGDRQKIMTVCTIDVHSRDVVAKMISQKVRTHSSFQWQQQLRHRWDTKENDCFVNICDAQFRYWYEYLGNSPRLVVTPLTDRCYITLTQSLHLVMGGAPAGPAGTGKTETTKDLGKGLGMMVYVFNCSEQMDYKSCGNIFKGLSLTGAWGCFDEFNRISVEVLSVVAVQVKSILNAIKAKRERFNFMGETISLIPTIGMFITMNPGYAGRTELPENVKSLFRPCAMVVPDFALICEIMLVAEGFQEARVLSRKFITLYTLCKELLSKQHHYDWGLRAIKSVLVVAGNLRRGDKDRPEVQVLMRALRDFNVPKIVTDDMPVFMDLIGDLFPALDVPRKRDLEFEKSVKQAAIDLKLQPEDNFILKVVQLEELFAVRHSVFIVGDAGTAKTCIWQTLNQTYKNMDRKPHYDVLSPKAVTNDELFGVINRKTGEWIDGLFSFIMRNQYEMPGDGPKWIVLDGDIDPQWIESLNTLMDDNKVLTLANNERIALKAEMRLLFEISHLKTATPATVSRAGILFINSADVGWMSYVNSWVDTRKTNSEKSTLRRLFDQYVPTLMQLVATKMKTIVPISPIAMIMLICNLLECLLDPENMPKKGVDAWYEMIFVFATIWGIGSSLFKDTNSDYREEFSKFFRKEFQTVTFPLGEGKNIFSYYVDVESREFRPWTDLLPEFHLNVDLPLQMVLVDNEETIRLKYFIEMLIRARRGVMLVGAAGCGKSVIMNGKLKELSDDYSVAQVPLNFYTSSEMMQSNLEKHLERRTGRTYRPIGPKAMIYFLDDMNMPEVDTYYTIQAHTIVRQFMDYSSWFDRADFVLKDIQKCQFVGAFNPTSGSFTIDPRLQRWFSTFAVNEPNDTQIRSIYFNILSQYLSDPLNELSKGVVDQCDDIVDASIRLHKRMIKNFLPTAQKFHYFFNMRDLTNVFQGLLWATKECCPNVGSLLRLWAHESTRVYCDKLITLEDNAQFEVQLKETIDESFGNVNSDSVLQKPLILFHFAESLNDAKYMPIKDFKGLNRNLMIAMENYNEFIGDMNLTLFEDAMSHITRISRIMNSDRGYGMLIGVGGFGKQSLTRLAAFINTLELFQTTVRKGFSIADFRAELATLYMKSGMKNINCCYLMTDAQVADEKFLVLINDFLATGHVSNLFAPEEVAEIASNMVNETKQAGIKDTPENCYNFFIEKVRRNLKMVLCFSPVGPTLKTRTRKFPALLNSTTIDWLFDWPREALKSVSTGFLANIDVLPKHLVEPVGEFMTFVHGTVNEISKIFNQNEKRYNYTTPKTFLELIALYDKLINDKTTEYKNRINTLQIGLLKLADCAKQVDGLKIQLKDQEVVLAAKSKDADEKFAAVLAENEKIQGERDLVAEEEKKVAIIEKGVSDKAKVCAADLKKAEPIMLKAIAALDTLDKKNLTELKAFSSPPEIVVHVCCAVSVLLTPKNRKVTPKAKRSWNECKKMMGTVDVFLQNLKNYDKKNIPPAVITQLIPYLNIPGFNGESIKSKSQAAAGLCEWVINIYKFYEVYLEVGPKERALEAAEGELRDAQASLQELTDKLLVFQRELDVLEGHLNDAIKMKEQCQAEADATAYKIDLAFRLVNGLASEKGRWLDSIEKYKESITMLAGDVLQIACFLSYVGGFTTSYRSDLQNNYWSTKLKSIQPAIPNSGGNPLEMICDDAVVAQWNNEGLPKDSMSVENAAIMLNSSRWPLIIDPQLQGVKWIRKRYGEDLEITSFKVKNYLDVVEKSIRNGQTLLIADISEEIDSILDPLLGRVLAKKGTIIVIGDKEIDYNPKFRLLLQTKLSNPHFKPEIQAQTTLINFSITADGLNQQLLAEVVKIERADLEERKANLTKQQNEFKITLKQLEEDLLFQLSNAGENVLEDESLVLNLEKSKKTSIEVEIQIEEARKTSIYIDEVRMKYKPVAERGVILYFILNNMNKVNPIYQFSLKSFVIVFLRGMIFTEPEENLTKRLNALQESITYQVFIYTNRALFERDKLMFTSLVAVQCLAQVNKVSPKDLDLLLRFQAGEPVDSPVNFLTDIQWGSIIKLTKLETLVGLDVDIETTPKLWRVLLTSSHPERQKLPGDWKYKSLIEQVCILKAMRPDRLISSMRCFIENNLGTRFIHIRQTGFEKTFEETSSSIHTFFTLSPGVDPMRDIEKLGLKMNFSFDANNLYSISLGQGQEIVAENALDTASQLGGWVVLQNIHLVAKWLPTLEKKIETITEEPHDDFRLFLSAEPAASAEYHVLPQGILESAVKITNEPPTGMQANIHSALDNFNQDVLEYCSKVTEFRALLFALCYFHAAVVERRKFGPIGWNRMYPYNFGDLTICVDILNNYLEANNSTPWDDLRYLFGEIMYGGHITDDWDRRLCRTYLEVYLEPKLTDGELYFSPGFAAPPCLEYDEYHHYVDLNLPIESPELYGLHSNTEVTILAAESQSLLETLLYLQPKRAESQSEESQSRESIMLEIIDEILGRVPGELPTYELLENTEERSPFTIVLFQECERMNILTNEMNRSLKELALGVKGFLATSADMEALSEALFIGNVPDTWTRLAYPSNFKLQAWLANLILRANELESWAANGALPPSVWLTGFFNPQSFLTAIMQQTARKNLWPLDRMCLNFMVTKKKKDDFKIAPRDGVNLHGLFMEGARWSPKLKSIVDAIPNELFHEMPVIYVTAITVDKRDLKNVYECPVYKGTMRGPTFVWTFDLKTVEPQSKWILAGVCLLLQN